SQRATRGQRPHKLHPAVLGVRTSAPDKDDLREDRIRTAKDTGLRNLPFHSFDANRIWLAVVALALDLTAWMQALALQEHDARRWEPKTLRLRLFSIPARLARHARRVHLRLSAHNPWTGLAVTAFTRLAAP
ncbi:hypothetical protein ABIA39_009128, partial [Nocardia sp. GAS34]|uniref:transposase n=1 Tax=unclassified Nocardia TaxID=2637762 RepID=UPI003D262EC7